MLCPPLPIGRSQWPAWSVLPVIRARGNHRQRWRPKNHPRIPFLATGLRWSYAWSGCNSIRSYLIHKREQCTVLAERHIWKRRHLDPRDRAGHLPPGGKLPQPRADAGSPGRLVQPGNGIKLVEEHLRRTHPSILLRKLALKRAFNWKWTLHMHVLTTAVQMSG